MNSKIYRILKFIGSYLLPIIGGLYFALSGVLELPNSEQVVGYILITDMIISVSILIFSKGCKKSTDGVLLIDTNDSEKDIYRLSLDTPLEELAGKKSIVLKIQNDADLRSK